MLLVISVFFFVVFFKTQKRSKKRQTYSGSSWLRLASPPKPEVVALSSDLCPSTSTLPGANQEQEEKDQCQDSHSPDRGSSMGYASGGSSPVQAYEGQNPNYKETPKEVLIKENAH